MYFRQSLVLSLSATAYELNGVAQIQGKITFSQNKIEINELLSSLD